ncbi:glutamyl-trna reductase chloroplastic [Hordeum vulgare]|nr:glutamyl-trna reductase chloroplastic [Hordeum vulgare]
MRAKESETLELQRILGVYERCSGQCVNHEKFAVMFSKNSSVQTKVRVKDSLEAFDTELHAVEKAVDLAAELGVLSLIIETDALLVTQALNRRTPDFPRQAHVIADVRAQAILWFSSCEFVHCKREANMPAHHLAKLGLALPEGDVAVFDDDVSAHVAAYVMGDLALNVA